MTPSVCVPCAWWLVRGGAGVLIICCARGFAVYRPTSCRLPLLVFALRDSAAAPKGGPARTSGLTLAGGGHPDP